MLQIQKALLVVIVLAICHSATSQQVKLKQGILKGVEVPLVTGDGSYYSFKGIPYAAAPILKRRFEQPYPPEKWSGVRSAKEHGNICMQQNYPSGTIGSEDCLFLNVYTSKLEPKKGLPVMVWIHGGGLIGGLGDVDLFGPDFLVQHDVVIVTFNYRLGALGFLSLNNSEVPGNAGFKDQVAALEWVQENIAQFGGDPKNVTIFGQSAGGLSVSLHMLSPLSKGLFHRAIAMSASALSEWALPFQSERRAFAIGQLLGFDTTDQTELLTFLRKVNASSLIGLTPTVLVNEEETKITKTYYYTYAIESDFKGKHFLTEDPLKLLKKRAVNKADFMTGHTITEFQSIFSPQFTVRYAKYGELFTPKRILNNVTPEMALEICDIMKKYYFGNETVGNASIKSSIKYFSDTAFNYDILKYIKLLGDSTTHSRYLYQFSAVSSRNQFSMANTESFNLTPTAGHSDDLFYMFDPKQFNLTMTKNTTEYNLVQQFTTLITNFAKYGNPTPPWRKHDIYLSNTTWPKYNLSKKSYLDFGTLSMTSGQDLNSEAVTLFDSVYKTAKIPY